MQHTNVDAQGRVWPYVIEGDALLRWSDRLSEYVPLRTADSVPIREGLRVFTNNLDRGLISLQSLRGKEFPHDGWFDVLTDTNYRGEPEVKSVLQNAERVATRFEGKAA